MNNWLPRFLIYGAINVAILWAAATFVDAIGFDSVTSLCKAGIWLAVCNLFFNGLLRASPLAAFMRCAALLGINVLLLFFIQWMVTGTHLLTHWRTALLAVFVSLATLLLHALISPPTEF